MGPAPRSHDPLRVKGPWFVSRTSCWIYAKVAVHLCIMAFITEPRVIQKILHHLAATGASGRGLPGSTERHPIAA